MASEPGNDVRSARSGRPGPRTPVGARSVLAATAAAILLAAAGASACGEGDGGSTSEEANGPSDLVMFVYDRSASVPDYMLEIARKLTNDRITHLEHGDRIAALEMLQRSLSEPPRRWTQAVPEEEFPDQEVYSDSVRLARFQRDAMDYLRRFTDTTDRSQIRNTDIFSSMHDAASIVQAYPEMRAVVYVFSDMLQSAGSIEMSGLREMPPSDWVEDQAREGQLPDLHSACIVVVGARVDSDAGQRVMGFWEDYFEAANAVLLPSNYMLRPVRLPVRPCR